MPRIKVHVTDVNGGKTSHRDWADATEEELASMKSVFENGLKNLDCFQMTVDNEVCYFNTNHIVGIALEIEDE